MQQRDLNMPGVVVEVLRFCVVVFFAGVGYFIAQTADHPGVKVGPFEGSGMGNGNAHDRNNPPVLLMGGANGRLKGDRHIVVEDKQPTANLLLGMAELANAEVEQIGHSTGRLSL